ncbi:MAG: GNAT family N-acetyltransferase [Lysobacterales bacterium]
MAQSSMAEGASSPPILGVGAFALRPLRLGDEGAWHAYLRVPGTTEHTSFPAVTPEAVRNWVERALAGYAAGGPYRWALVNAADILVGTCGFSAWSVPHGHAELVYDLNPEYQHQGLMTQTVAVALQWVWSSTCFHRIHAYVMTSNRPSIALLERAGFECEGTLKAFRIARGTPRDFHVYARLRTGVAGSGQTGILRDDSGRVP